MVTIAVISGFIILAALYMTSWEQKIEYPRFTTGEIVWISEQTRNPDYLWHEDTFIYAHPDGTWRSMDFSRSDLHTFADSTRVTQTLSLDIHDLKSVSGIWPNSKRTACGQRVPIRSPADGSDAVHSANWAKLEFALFIQAGQHLYYSENIVSQPPRCLTCLLATTGWTYGHPGWTYRQYFYYEPSGAYQQSVDDDGRYVLVLGTDDRHLRALSVPQFVEPFGPEKPQFKRAVYMPFESSAKNIRVPLVNILLIDTLGALKYNLSWDKLNEHVAHDASEARTTTKAREIFITRIQWFNATSFLIVGLREAQNCGFILFCQWFETSSKLSCQHIWYQCVEHGWLDMRTGRGSPFGVTTGENDFLTILPFIGTDTAYQLVILHIIAGQRNRITWLTESPIRVGQLVWADYKTVLFTASMQPAIRHLYRLDRGYNNKLFCLTCHELTESTIETLPVYDPNAVRIVPVEEIDTNSLPHSSKWTTRGMSFRTVHDVRPSANGACFTILWSTGCEAFGAFGVREAPTRLLINQLTGTSHEAAEYDSMHFEETAHFDPDSGIGVWCQRVSPHGDVAVVICCIPQNAIPFNLFL
ncbi:hypothetical protein P879_00023 [Paragonimus westermani]|uniref:Dipeptidylpeptidase IV N-terminal domain-containing protein n=1 Tax=Paragonimus westermani TaxID=34504 RepID=A0A8T0DYT2_9TREM|nr:hypothetical protein P879_00023 [Paragonimus westermani]